MHGCQWIERFLLNVQREIILMEFIRNLNKASTLKLTKLYSKLEMENYVAALTDALSRS